MSRFAIVGILLCSLTVFSIGCGSSRSERPQAKPSVMEDWAEGKEFFTSDDSYGVFGNLADGNAKVLVPELKNPTFKAALDKFEAAALPAGFEDKQAAKDKLVEKIKALVEEANGSANKKKIKELSKEVQAAQQELVKRG